MIDFYIFLIDLLLKNAKENTNEKVSGSKQACNKQKHQHIKNGLLLIF
jgi:hypothetical protein